MKTAQSGNSGWAQPIGTRGHHMNERLQELRTAVGIPALLGALVLVIELAKAGG